MLTPAPCPPFQRSPLRHLITVSLATAFVLSACECEPADGFDPQGEFVPALLDLGPVPEGTSCEALLVLTNTGGSDLSIDSGGLENENGTWENFNPPSFVGIGGAENVGVDYTSGGTLNERQSVVIALQTNDPDNDGEITGTITALPVDGSAALGVAYCTNDAGDKAPCEGAVDFGAVNIGDINVPIEQRTGRSVEVIIKNDGSAPLEVSAALLNEGNPNFTVTGVEQGNLVVELPLTLEPSRTEACVEAQANPLSELKVNVFYAPTTLGADTETLLVVTDAVENPNIEVPLTGFGSDIGILLNPTAISFGDTNEDEVYTETMLVSNLGTNDAAVNNTCLDVDDDGTCDANCTGSDDDTALGGTLRCRVYKANGTTDEGKGFILKPTDAQAGGEDERVLEVMFSPVAGNADIPPNTFVLLESAILNNTVYKARVVGGGIGDLDVNAGANACGGGICINAQGDFDDTMTWTGAVTVELVNSGEASLDITAFVWDGPPTIADDYFLETGTGAAIDETTPGISLAPNATMDLVIQYANADFSGADYINLNIENTGVLSPVVVPLEIIPPPTP